MSPLADTAATPAEAPQRVVKTRRDYNAWVARETIEDYALRFTPRSFRRWSEWRVANTAFGAASFLILEAVGATLLVQYGFVNAALAILATGLVIFLAGWPISVYAARHGVDMDLLTRGAGFGYIGSTITSLIYASFTFIFFALEAAVMAYALELALDIPPALGYLLCALVVIPLVTHGVTAISRLQVWTQPLWIAMLVVPYVFVFRAEPDLLAGLSAYGGEHGITGFDGLAFGAATTVGIALITQMGEQADYLRFMPEKANRGGWRWHLAVLAGGPGWVLPGVLKMLGGALLAYLAITRMVPLERAVDPNQMYLAAYETVFSDYGVAVAVTAAFVLVSQLKINVTNAYAGSLAWSNFFSRLTHAHPGRVVWMVFNTGIALVLMEMNVFQALSHVLGLYANVAIAWMMAVVADLVVNKPLGWSPPGIEFKRAHLYDINPVGVGAMGIASALSVAAHLGAFGELAQAYSAAIALVTAFVCSPLIAWATKGRYYLARTSTLPTLPAGAIPIVAEDAPRQTGGTESAKPGVRSRADLTPDSRADLTPDSRADLTPDSDLAAGRYARLRHRCTVCEREYETEDMAFCPAYQAAICSLCCTLDARCHDLCKPRAKLFAQWRALLSRLLPARMAPQLDAGLADYLLLMGLVTPALALVLGIAHRQALRLLGDQAAALGPTLAQGFVSSFLLLWIAAGVGVWWGVLAHRSRAAAQEESNRQTLALQREIESHARTDAALQAAREEADRARGHAEAANRAKSRYITTISHELRTPLNSILGYAQLLEEDEAMPPHRRQAVAVIRRGGDHLLSLIEGTLDIARIESGKLALDVRPMRFADGLAEIARMFELQAAGRGLAFRFAVDGRLPAVVRADEKRLRQILINLLGNAIKFTQAGQVTLRVAHQREMARFEIEDTGPGMTADELARVFEPFERGSAASGQSVGSTGLGLTIARMLCELMGGEMTVASEPGRGTTFRIRLFVPEVAVAAPEVDALRARRVGYEGRRRRVLAVDNEEADRRLVADLLQPLGFEVEGAATGEAALARLAADAPYDAVFMDLAMPGIDGWETIRRLRAAGHGMPLAVVSANAFDKKLDNDVGLPGEDFLVKPVRVGELLDWLGGRLGLDWRYGARVPEPAPPPPPADAPLPPPELLRPLRDALALGHVRGVARQLAAIEAADPAHAGFAARMRLLARQFNYETMNDILDKALDEPRAA
ncbi:hybrid sensor histidine kinase/response regulator [Rubrivivax benzoatilyticus]|uniref:histidine kinase n=1 Tax=Rubrivivax benzoatilyticus TaxID=316997 RepID=A0ABX0HUM5_9BURK|nr:ATP-binding protein [Rubrivivax benzoatilyticus]EGJ10218.1 periplasmic sensor hybrid histidine kinase [Rubrivivax benzoatilyticus JA2 = ATCC BAA-35]NHK98005.1 response regulator [Rubrivivax benzoatilyticus]NHL23507.1 response regulator [Rubrivivax benzoatilyticus]